MTCKDSQAKPTRADPQEDYIMLNFATICIAVLLLYLTPDRVAGGPSLYRT